MADDEGVPVEAAASLFGGGDEAATDFFATTFDNLSSSQDPKISDKTSLMHHSDVAENIFEAAPPSEDSSLFVPNSYETPHSSFGDGSVEDNPHPTNSQGPSQGSLGHDDGQSQGWQDGQGQWHDYNYQNNYASTYDYPLQYESTGAYVPQDDYSPPLHDYTQRSTEYVPPIAQSRTPPASHFSDYSQRYGPQQPTQPLHSHQTTYSAPYAASQNANYSHGPINSYSLTSQPTNQATVLNPAIPPQGAPTQRDVNAYRPTTLTAYDPPISRKNKSKARSAFPDPSISQDHFNDVRPSHASAPFPPPPPPPSRIPQDAMGRAAYSAPTQGYNPSQLGNDEWLQKHETVTASKAEVADRNPTHQISEEVWETSTLGGRLNSQPAATSFRDGEYLSENPEELAAREQSSSEETTLYDPEEAVGSVPLGQSTYTSSSEPDYVYGLDDQPFADGDHATQAPIHPASPPLRTASPVSLASEATGGHPQSGVITDEHSDDPYHPKNLSRTNSGASYTGSTFSGTSVSASHIPAAATTARNDSIGSISHDPYAPPSRLHNAQSRDSDFAFGSEHASRYDYAGVSAESGASPDLDTTTGSTYVLTAPTYAPYAPSPSLLGTNDPLGRATARVPVISFGFGGKLVSCFHSASDISGGFDVSLTARRSTDVHIHVLHEVIPASAMDSSTLSYPGPLFFDPGTPSISLARTVGVGVASNIKSKKMLVSKWLEERANDISKGVAFLPSGSQERFATEGKLVLVRLLKAMLDNDGQLSGSPTIEWAARTALVPRLDSETPSSSVDGLSSTDMSTYSSPHADLNEAPLAVYQLRSSSLDRIQEFLLRGERHKAYHYALDQKLWGHAMLIASSIDNQAWKEVVKEFLHCELAVKQQHSGSFSGSKAGPNGPSTNGRESLRVAYSLLAGHGATSVQELIPPRSMSAIKPDTLLVPQRGMHVTPVSPNFPQPALTSSVPPEALAKWNETAAMMAFSQVPGDSAALTALGDYLAANRWFEAAHACYLLSPRTSSFGGVRQPSVRLVLVGSESPSTLCNFAKDLDVTIFSEVVEFALSFSSSKGQDAFVGLPHLQPYKLIRAAHLAEMGHVDAANRYCEAIGSVIRASMRGSLFYTPTFIGELKNLSDRLTAAPQLDKTASWISSKLSKPSLDTIGSWLEGRFSKLIVGEGEGGQQAEENEQTSQSRTSYGPFSHYSNISSATTSASPSPSPTPYLPNGVDTVSRTPSVPLDGEYRNTLMQIDRASSAMDHLRPQVQRASPVQRVASASATTTTFAQTASLSARNFNELGTMKDVPESEGDGETDGQEAAWWGSNSLDKNGRTPTATTFYKVDEGQSEGNFVSLMDSYSPKNAVSSPLRSQRASKGEVKDEDEEDLGLGNTTTRTPKPDDKDSKPVSAAEQTQKPDQEKPDSQPKTTSWFGRWWNRSSEPAAAAGAGPIRAKLGEESSFYYDKELKRWVNKKAGSEATPSTPPPPPPSRPRTASPSPGAVPPPAKGGPHARPASAAELTMPPRKPPRARSNLIPTEEPATPGSATSSTVSLDTPTSGLAPTLGGINRPKSSASKRNVRNRYVDILQQQGDS